MGLHFVNSYSIFSASPGAYDFYRPKELFQRRDHWTWNQKTWVKSCHCHLLIKRAQGFINLRGHLWCPNLCNICAKCQDNLVYICFSVCKYHVLNLGVKTPWLPSQELTTSIPFLHWININPGPFYFPGDLHSFSYSLLNTCLDYF